MNFLSNFDIAVTFLSILALIILIVNLLIVLSYIFKNKVTKQFVNTFWYKKRAIVLLVLDILIGILFYTTIQYNFTKSPEVIDKYPKSNEAWTDMSKPITVTFDRPIQKNIIETSIFPDTKGAWKVEYVGWIIKFPRKVVFYPSESIKVNQKITLYFTKVQNLLQNKNGFDHEDHFQSAYLPNISGTTPKDGSTDISVNTVVNLKLDNPTGPFAVWTANVVPYIPFKLIDSDVSNEQIVFNKPLAQNTTYTISVSKAPAIYTIPGNEVISKGEMAKLTTFSFTTAPNPSIVKSSPNGSSILTNEKISVTFNDEIVKDTVKENFDINPKITGSFTWTDNKTFIFTPASELQKDTTYTVTLKPGIKSLQGTFVNNEIKFDFTTIGPVKVKNISPQNGQSALSIYTPINIEFDQGVNEDSAQSKFSLNPPAKGGFIWKDNQMTFQPEVLSFGTKYTITIDPNVQSVNGTYSHQQFTYSFTTQPEEFVLDVPQFYQTNKYDCNLVATKMALGYKGVNVTTDDIVNSIGYSEPRDRSGNTWGNPNEGYVGYRDGPGYGVHWDPVSKYISAYRKNTVKTGWNIQGIAKEVESGNPVILWWNNGLSTDGPDSWNSPAGPVTAYEGMHSEVVVGFDGPVENPTNLILNDPWRGRRIVSISNFNSLWSTFNNTAIVVY